MEQTKILHIITTFDFGGAETLLKLIVNKQSENYDVTIAYLKGNGGLKTEINKNVRVIKIGLGVSTVINIRRLICREKPHIIHTHLGHADLLTMIGAIGLKGCYFSTMHNIWFKKGFKDYCFFAFYILFSHSIARNFKYIAISKSVYRHINRNFRVSRNRLRLIYNAIDLSNVDKPHLRTEKENNEVFQLLFVGRLTLQKNLFFLIRNFAVLLQEFPTLKLTLVGDGELKTELMQLVNDLGIEQQVAFEGYQSNPDEYFANADCFILTSIFEGFGLVILEAFRAGVPVLASNIEGPKELILSGENGLLFENNNADDFVLKFKRMYSSHQLRQQFVMNGARKLNYRFSISNYMHKLHDFYHS
ncbi:MAG TPA: glycosyltransferase [Segetibacter sp.]|jgi:glycosyltransferase involved in cell wall biosynthesis